MSSRGRRFRLLLSWSLVVASVVVIVPSALAGNACPGVQHAGRWSNVLLPTGMWLDGVVSTDSSGMFLTDGRQIVRSVDGGCKWSAVYALGASAASPDDATQDPEYQIAQLAAPRAGGKSSQANYVYALAVDNAVGALTFELPAVVIVSSDGGKSWHVSNPSLAGDIASQGPRCLASIGVGTHLLVSPADPRVLLLECAGTSFGDLATALDKCQTSYFRSTDAGATWTSLTPTYGLPQQGYVATPPALTCGTANTGWAADPSRTTVGYQATSIYGPPSHTDVSVSTDGWQTYKRLFSAPGSGAAQDARIDAARGPNGVTRVLLCGAAGGFLSVDAGRTRVAIPPTPPPILRQGRIFDCALTPDGRAVVVLQTISQDDGSSPMEAFRFDIASKRWSVLPAPPAPPRTQYPSASLHVVGSTARPVFYFLSGSSSSFNPDHLEILR